MGLEAIMGVVTPYRIGSTADTLAKPRKPPQKDERKAKPRPHPQDNAGFQAALEQTLGRHLDVMA